MDLSPEYVFISNLSEMDVTDTLNRYQRQGWTPLGPAMPQRNGRFCVTLVHPK